MNDLLRRLAFWKEPEIKIDPSDPRNDYNEIDIRELRHYANYHTGKKVVVRGKVFNIKAEKRYLQMWVKKPRTVLSSGDASIAVMWRDNFPLGVYHGSHIAVYGEVFGFVEGQNVIRGTVKTPLVFADIIDKD